MHACILIDTISINLNLMFMYISQIYYNVTNKVARSRHMVACQRPRKPCGTQFASVLFTGTISSPYSIPHISITTGKISFKFTYFMPSYTQFYIPNLKKIGQIVHEIAMCS